MAEPFNNNGGMEVSHLEARYRHLDDRVGRLSQDVAGISATLAQVSHTLESISHKVNTPTRTEWSAIIAGCAFVASLGYSAIMPLKERINVHANSLQAISDRQRDVAETLGVMQSAREAGSETHRHMVEDIATIRRDVQSIMASDAATDAKVNSLAERVRDVDMAGSRRWIQRDNE